MSEIVFILGAGASKHAGAPLMNDFLDKADELRKSKQLNEFQEDFDRVFNARSALQSVYSKAFLDLNNLEKVFAAFEMGKLIDKFPEFKKKEIKLLLISIRRVIFKTLEMSIVYPVSSSQINPDKVYNLFVDLLRNLKRTRQKWSSVITFNYDVVLDHALYTSKIPLDYCLTGSNLHDNIALLKLHGSLNWCTCSKCRKIIPFDVGRFFENSIFPPDKGGFIQRDIASKIPYFSEEHCRRKLEEPFIVPPTWNKTEYNAPLSRVWKRAAQELSEAENVFISGYSLNETDLFFRYLFALGSVSKTMINRFWVFDPDENGKVKSRFEELIGQGTMDRFQFKNMTFEGAINTIGREFKVS